MTGDLFAAARVPREARVPKPAPADTLGHRCAVCGADAAFGFDVFLRRGRHGRWACLAHRDQVGAMIE